MLRPISAVLAGKLEWVQPKTMQRKYELRAADGLVATLEYKSAFGSLAVAASSDGIWTFKRVGFFNPRVTVRRQGEEQDLAVYRPRWTGNQGTIRLADGLSILGTSLIFGLPAMQYPTQTGKHW